MARFKFPKFNFDFKKLFSRAKSAPIAADPISASQASSSSRFDLVGYFKEIDPEEAFQKLSKHVVLWNSFAIILCAYFLATLTVTFVTPMIPDVKKQRIAQKMKPPPQIGDYARIAERNLFNERGLIPDTESRGNPNSVPVKTTLPLNLLGIIMLTDQLKSVASIEDKSSNQVVAVRVNEQVNQNVIINQIESRKVIFFNRNEGRREFLELPEDLSVLNIKPRASAPTVSGGIQKLNEGHYVIDRGELDKALSDNNVLTQARCIPNFKNGRPNGYRCFQIEPGSVFNKLGVQENDVVIALNGNPLNDITSALTMFQDLKTKSVNSVEIQLERNDRPVTLNYDIR